MFKNFRGSRALVSVNALPVGYYVGCVRVTRNPGPCVERPHTDNSDKTFVTGHFVRDRHVGSIPSLVATFT